MSSNPISPLRRAWFRWKALRLPWRKKFLVGLDLSGATFWEFTDALSPDPRRMRRIVHPPSNLHYSDVSARISPAWHQWLRHTRLDPPSLTEQSQDLLRQEQLKVLAAQADARWEAKARLVDMPGGGSGRAVPPLRIGDMAGYGWGKGPDGRAGEEGGGGEGQVGIDVEGGGMGASVGEMQNPRHSMTRGERAPQTMKDKKEDPWKKAKGGPSEEWQPETWDPNALAARR